MNQTSNLIRVVMSDDVNLHTVFGIYPCICVKLCVFFKIPLLFYLFVHQHIVGLIHNMCFRIIKPFSGYEQIIWHFFITFWENANLPIPTF